MNKNLENIMDDIRKNISQHQIAEMEYVQPLAQVLQDGDPRQFIKQFFDIYNKSLDSAYTDKNGVNQRSFVQAIAGGPFESIPWALYNVIGEIYPYLDREVKDEALGQILRCLDRLNYTDVNGLRGTGHTTGIREPLLLADICILRWLYFPGIEEGQWLQSKYDNFFDFQKDLMDEEGCFIHKPVGHDMNEDPGVNSDFMVAYSLITPEHSKWGEQYIKSTNPQFLERVVRGVVWTFFGDVLDDNELYQKRMNEIKKALYPVLHDRIEPIVEERGWVDKRKFT